MRNRFFAALATGALVFSMACSKNHNRAQIKPLGDPANGEWIADSVKGKDPDGIFVEERTFVITEKDKEKFLSWGQGKQQLAYDFDRKAFIMAPGTEQEKQIVVEGPTLDKDGQKLQMQVFRSSDTNEALVAMTLIRPLEGGKEAKASYEENCDEECEAHYEATKNK